MKINQETDNYDLKTKIDSSLPVKGNILLFHAFNVGESIDINLIKEKKMIRTSATLAFPHFKNYHVPLFVQPPSIQPEKNNSIEFDKNGHRVDCIYARIHNFGAFSFCYKIPFCSNLDSLKIKIIQIAGNYRKIGQKDAKSIYDSIIPAIKKPSFFNLRSEYYAIQVNTLPTKPDPEEFKEKFGSKIASLLRLETETLSEFQEEEILNSVTGYYGRDMIIIDTEGALIYDNEYYEAIEFFELSNVQKLELQCFDRKLDQELNTLHKDYSHQLPISAYIPLLGTNLDTLLSRLIKLRLDVSVISERLTNSIKMVGDAYYAKLYEMLVYKLRLEDWKGSINEKMEILNDLYQFRKGKLDTIRGEMLEVVIILMIAIEVTVAFIKH